MKVRFFALALFAAPLIAAPPRVVNGNVQTIASIVQAESQAGPLWVGYSIPTARSLYVSCCDGWSHCDQCRLDGDHGFSMTHRDPEEDVRAHAVFAISQLPDDQGIPLLIELANTHRSTAVRKKAIFWLGQKHDPRALAAIEDILRK